MTTQLATVVRNAQNDAVEAAIGASPRLRILSGVKPASTEAADAGTVLATIDLPADWMENSAGGVKGMKGTWVDNAADASGIAVHYRIYNSAGVCMMQGGVSATGGGGELQVDNVNFAAGQTFQITAYSWTAGNSNG